MHLRLEEIRQDIKDASSNYLANMPTPNKHLLGAAGETITEITELFQAHHYYPGTTATPTSQISSPDSTENLNPNLR